MNKSFPQPPERKGFPKLPGTTPTPPPTHSSGRISGFPTPPNPKVAKQPSLPQPERKTRTQPSLPQPERKTRTPPSLPQPERKTRTPPSLPQPIQPENPRVYSPSKLPSEPLVEDVTQDSETKTEEDIIIISDEELKDMKDYRAALNVKFLDDPKVYQLASSPDHVVRQELAMNPDTPPQILEILSKDPHPQVREEIVYNPSTSQEAYENMVDDRSTWVKEALLTNSRTPYSMLTKIDVGEDVYLKSLLIKRL